MGSVVRYESNKLQVGDAWIDISSEAFDSPALVQILQDGRPGQPIRLLRYLLPQDQYHHARKVLASAPGDPAQNTMMIVRTILEGECPELMTLLWMMHNHPNELRFDFRRFLQMDFDKALTKKSPRLMAGYAVAMPAEGSLHRVINPDWRWGITEQILAGIYDQMSYLRWEAVKIAGGKPGKAPDQMERPGVSPSADTDTVGASEGFESMEDFDAVYAEIKARMKPAPE